MTQSGNAFRKIFIDSRWRSGGGHNDFSIELPSDVDTSRTSSVYLASCSFSNTFETILSGVNDRLYYVSKDTAHVPSIVASNDTLYFLANTGVPWIWVPPAAKLAYFARRSGIEITASNNTLYYLSAVLQQGGTSSYTLYSTTIPQGRATPAELAALLQARLSQTMQIGTVAYQSQSDSLAFTYNSVDLGNNTTWTIPSAAELDAVVSSFQATLAPGVQFSPGNASNTLNRLLNMPNLASGSRWAYSGVSGPLSSATFQVTPSNSKLYLFYRNPLQADSYVLYAKTVSLGTYSAPQLAAQLQAALAPVVSGVSVSWNGQAFAINFGSANYWIPNSLDLDAAVTRFNPTFADSGSAISPGDHSGTMNNLLSMARLQAGSPFAQSVTSGVIGQQYSYQLRVVNLPSGRNSASTFATILRLAVDSDGSLGTTVEVSGQAYACQWTANGSPIQIYVPPASQVDALLASTGASIVGDYAPGGSAALFNGSWLPIGDFGWSAVLPLPPRRNDWPWALSLPRADRVSLADLAATLQTAIDGAAPGGYPLPGTSATVQGSTIVLDTNGDVYTLRLPTHQELTSAAWRRANWPEDILPIPADPKAYNELMPLPSPSVAARTVTLAGFQPYTETHVVPMSPQQYSGGVDLAAALQLAVRDTNATATVQFFSNLGTLVIRSPPPWTLQFPTDRELRDASWRRANWDPYPTSWVGDYNLANPRSLNAQLYFPSPSVFREYTSTGNIDLIPYREVYLSSSLTNFRTLQAGTGAQDILARVPIDVNYGEVVTFRAYNHDAISASDQHFRVMRFRFTDYAGRLVPIDQPVIIELAFVDSDPYAL